MMYRVQEYADRLNYTFTSNEYFCLVTGDTALVTALVDENTKKWDKMHT